MIPPPPDSAASTSDAASPPAPVSWDQAVIGAIQNWPKERPLKLMVAFFLLFLGTYSTTFYFMMQRWTHDPAATHGWLVLPIIAWVIWEKREKLRGMPLGSDSRGLWVMAFALLMHLAERAIDLNGPSPLSIPIFVAGAVWYFAGTAWLRELAFPIGYLCFMIPVPGGLTEVVSNPLRLLATNGSRAIVKHFGITIYGSGMHMEFFQPTGYEYIRLEVADPCSGLHSLMAIKALHAITAYKSRLTVGWKWVLFMCAIPVSLAANLCRMVSIILVAAYISKSFGLGMWHENIAPYILFAFAFLILISLGRFMEWATGATRNEKGKGGKDGSVKTAAAVATAEAIVEGAAAL